MSTIAAVVSATSRPPASTDIESLLSPGIYATGGQPRFALDGPAALGASIVPILTEDTVDDQPLSVGRLRVAFAGRLDNRDELAGQLGGDAASDAMLAALAYRSWGTASAERMIGSFACIVWDAERDRLYCATDHMSDRTLFYAEPPGAFVVASTIRQVRGYPGVHDDLDEGYLLTRLWVPVGGGLHSPRTSYVGIKRVLPGGAVLVTPGRPAQTWRYWRPEEVPEADLTMAEFSEEVHHRLATAVRAQSRSRDKVMCTLSGGLDSSSITGLVARAARESTLACSGFEAAFLDFDGDADANEREFREAAERHYGIEALRLDGGECWHFRDVGPGGSVPTPDEPAIVFCGVSDVRQLAAVSEKAGCPVVLLGSGGDELLTGSNHLVGDLLRRGRLLAAWRYLRLLARRSNRTYVSSLFSYGLRPVLGTLRPGRPGLPRAGAREQDLYGFRLGPPPWLMLDRRRRRLVTEIYQDMGTLGRRPYARSNDIEVMRGSVATVAVLNDILFYPHGVELRTPFYDRRVVELALGMPGRFKLGLSDGRLVTKHVLRQAMRDILPPEIAARRSKANFVSEAAGGLDREWHRIWNGGDFEIVRRGLVDGASWTRALRAARLGRWEHGSQLAAAVAVELWLRAREPCSGEGR